MPGRAPWRFAGLPDNPRLAIVHLNDRLRDLEDYLQLVHEETTFGPLAGAYIPFRFIQRSTPVVAAIQDLTMTPFASRPIGLSVWTENAASIYTVQVRYNDGSGPTDVLNGSKQITHKQLFRSRSDFAVDWIPAEADLYFEVLSVGDSGSPAPNHLRAMLVVKAPSKLEPA